jgi:hypothetical protein
MWRAQVASLTSLLEEPTTFDFQDPVVYVVPAPREKKNTLRDSPRYYLRIPSGFGEAPRVLRL